jgi:hypothetical protein
MEMMSFSLQMVLLFLKKQMHSFGLLVFTLLIPGILCSQSKSGRVLSTETQSGISFVSIGIIGKNVGTVSDEYGNFSIKLDKIYDNDSIRFSIIGYETKTFLVHNFKIDTLKTVFLKPILYEIKEVTIKYRRQRIFTIGEEVTSGNLVSGFASNDLGAEMGIKAYLRVPLKLNDINLNVAACTFDSVTYRLNIYELINENEYRKVLQKPVYISFSKHNIKKAITFDLRKYLIDIKGSILITLELYKDLGKGNLLFYTKDSEDIIYHKKTSEGTWTTSFGALGFYLHGQRIE